MTDFNPQYDSWNAMTWQMQLASSDTNLLAGRGSAVVNNQVNRFADYQVGGTFTGPSTGAAAGVFQIYAYGATEAFTTFTAGLSGSDAAATLEQELKDLLFPLPVIPLRAQNSFVYTWGPFSILEAFRGLIIPAQWGLWGVHNGNGAFVSFSASYLGVRMEGV